MVFAPKPRDYRYNVNKKIRRLALKSVLSDKASEGKIIVIDSLNAEEYKTRVIADCLKAVKAEGKVMLAYAGENDKLFRSARNIEKVNPTAVSLTPPSPPANEAQPSEESDGALRTDAVRPPETASEWPLRSREEQATDEAAPSSARERAQLGEFTVASGFSRATVFGPQR